MIDREQIECVLQDNHLNHVYSDVPDRECWTIFCSDGVVTVTLAAEGDYLLIRGGPICLGDCECRELRLGTFMLENERLSVGRFVGVDEVYFEVPFSLPDGASLTNYQILHAITTTLAVLFTYQRDGLS
jgi:hypothetical protein